MSKLAPITTLKDQQIANNGFSVAVSYGTPYIPGEIVSFEVIFL